MASLTRCPSCDTFVKPASIDDSLCPFCPAATAAGRRNPIPGVMLAAALAVAPAACSDDAKPAPDANTASDGAVYGIAIGDAAPADAMENSPDGGDVPLYGVAPE